MDTKSEKLEKLLMAINSLFCRVDAFSFELETLATEIRSFINDADAAALRMRRSKGIPREARRRR